MTRITITIDLQSSTPIYEQIKEQIIELIAKGELKPGDTLPSVRELATMLGINMLTVHKAYTSLVNEGYLVVVKKRFVVKSSIKDEKWKDLLRKAVNRALASHVSNEEILSVVRSMLEGRA